jgi:serine phosphatase RsbU (regulator of sigma subunit)
MHINLNDSLSNTYLIDQIAEMSEKYEADKKQQEIELLMEDKKNTDQKNKIQELENLNQKAELAKSNTVVYFSIGGLVLLLVFAFILIKRIRLKGAIFRQLKQQKEDILFAKQIIEAKNKDILDSIMYAKKIQDAILHEENKALKNLDQHFVIFQPKDIVSGDFYWTLEKNNIVYAAVADCTGHGVPGAFMSMLGIAFLNEITKSGELKSPAEILNELRTKVIKELGQSGTIGENKDGMDISLVKIDRNKNLLEFSGAHNPLLIIRDNEIIQLNADKQPIGYQEEQKPFTNHFLDMKQGDMMYLLSDGYVDQFGGELTTNGKGKGKKFKMARFKELIQKISTIETEIQKNRIETAFFDWKGDMEQIDDVCIMGIKIGR